MHTRLREYRFSIGLTAYVVVCLTVYAVIFFALSLSS